MKSHVENFCKQLEQALDIADKASLGKLKMPVTNIVITGLGGSGIGGTIVSELIADSCPVPVLVNKDYTLPAYINENTLLIVSSYSGNTEETLQAMQQGIEQKAQIVCVTSGGKIGALAKEHGYDAIIIPGGNPPRSCIGYSLVQLVKILVHFGFAPVHLLKDFRSAIDLLTREEKAIKTEARQIAEKLLGKLAVIYSLGACEGVTVRFRQQINENSKMLCWHHVLPEMNHNELVGWTERNEDLAVITFHTSFDYSRVKKRYDVCKPIFEKYASSVSDIFPKGESKLEQFLYHIHIGDWISCFVADLRGVDPIEVNVIDHLKNELAKF